MNNEGDGHSQDRLSLLHWLIDRCDMLRSSYSSRAMMILTVDTFIIGILVFISDKFRPRTSGWGALVWIVIAGGLVAADRV